MQNIFRESKNKTRVLVLSTQPSITKLLLEVLRFNGKDFGYYQQNEIIDNLNADFVILETSDIEKASFFEPNIVLITSEISGEKLSSLLAKITAGGIVVYPAILREVVEQSETYFRRLEFEETAFQQSNNSFTLQTNLGPVPISSADQNLIKNTEGLKLLCQQFGVMEEEFYEPVMNFQ